MSEVIVTSTST